MRKDPLRYGRKNPICQRIVIVDGLARSAKSLTCRVLSHLKHGDHYQYPLAIEHMCYLRYLDAVEEAVAVPFVQFIADEQVYCRIIGRNLNTRVGDTSSIYQCHDHAEYVLRSESPGGMEAINKFNDERRWPIFQFHSAIVSGSFLFKALPEARIVHNCRHPIDQVYKWIARGWGDRETRDPLSFVPIIESPWGTVPWFASDWAEKYCDTTNPLERALESVLFLQKAENDGIEALDEKQKKKIHRICLEHLATEPDNVIPKIAEFLESEPHETMETMLREERVPRVIDPAERKKFFREIKEIASEDRIERLLSASRVFEEKWDIDPFRP